MSLSGFIFYALCRNRKVNCFEFIRNRILRIAPLFIVWTLILFYTNDIDSTKLIVAVLTLVDKGQYLAWVGQSSWNFNFT
jgi:peptidoglycan/LPS O-acetylase OafA/YrhL